MSSPTSFTPTPDTSYTIPTPVSTPRGGPDTETAAPVGQMITGATAKPIPTDSLDKIQEGTNTKGKESLKSLVGAIGSQAKALFGRGREVLQPKAEKLAAAIKEFVLEELDMLVNASPLNDSGISNRRPVSESELMPTQQESRPRANAMSGASSASASSHISEADMQELMDKRNSIENNLNAIAERPGDSRKRADTKDVATKLLAGIDATLTTIGSQDAKGLQGLKDKLRLAEDRIFNLAFSRDSKPAGKDELIKVCNEFSSQNRVASVAPQASVEIEKNLERMESSIEQTSTNLKSINNWSRDDKTFLIDQIAKRKAEVVINNNPESINKLSKDLEDLANNAQVWAGLSRNGTPPDEGLLKEQIKRFQVWS